MGEWAHVISCYQDGGVGSCNLLLSFFVIAFDMLFPTSVGKSKDTLTTAFKFVQVTHNHTPAQLTPTLLFYSF